MASKICKQFDKNIPRTITRLISRKAPNLAQLNNLQEQLSQLQEEKIQKTRPVTPVNNANFKIPIASLERTSSPENPRLWSAPFETEREFLNRNQEKKILQPALLPTLNEKKIFDSKFMDSLQETDAQMNQINLHHNSASQKVVEKVKKDLMESGNMKKFPKLNSSPFPDPLKSTTSPYTLSDKEKAQQMLDDQKNHNITFPNNQNTSKKFYGTMAYAPITQNTNSIFKECRRNFYVDATSKTRETSCLFYGLKNNGTFDLLQTFDGTNRMTLKNFDQKRRFFGKKKEQKCTKVEMDKKKCQNSDKLKKISKMKLKGCPPPRKNIICHQEPSEVQCKKIEAPYPSFSESCYMEPKNRQTECDICPWARKHNPNFKKNIKIPTREYHTEKNTFKSSSSPPASSFELIYDKIRKEKETLCSMRRNNDINHRLCEEPSSTENTQASPSILTEYLMGNGNLLKDFRNGDDLEDHGVDKSKLSQLLCSSSKVSDLPKNKGKEEKEYPRNCDEEWKGSSMNCPTGLTHKKTNKERLKKRKPKVNKC